MALLLLLTIPYKLTFWLGLLIATIFILIALFNAASKGKEEFDKVYDEYSKNFGEEYFYKYRDVSSRMSVLVWSIALFISFLAAEFICFIDSLNEFFIGV